jgi:demethylmenaquinone methyltransferase / 2-methoxy-6-polyprenyl-1,4-benzoquinol methylase
MRHDSRLDLVERFFSGTGSSYDHIVNLCTLGIDRLWKKRILKQLANPQRVMDLACGTGILTFAIAERFPDCRVIGVELRDEYLKIARQKAKALRILNVEFILSRAEDVLFDQSFDCITSSYLAKYAELKPLVSNMTRMLRSGGLVLFHDFTYPSNPMLAAGWEIYFKLLQRLGTLRYPQWKTVFYGLPDLVRQTVWVSDLQLTMRDCGLTQIELEYLTLGASAIITARKP